MSFNCTDKALIKTAIGRSLPGSYGQTTTNCMLEVLTSDWFYNYYVSNKPIPKVFMIAPLTKEKERLIKEIAESATVGSFTKYLWTYMFFGSQEDLNLAKLVLNEKTPSMGLIPVMQLEEVYRALDSTPIRPYNSKREVYV